MEKNAKTSGMIRGRSWIFCAVLVGLALTGCSSFRHEWRQALTQTPSHEIAGSWEGEWRSEKNGHHGRLRGVVKPTPTNTYTARFQAKFWKIFTATYSVPVEVTGSEGRWLFSGAADLGWLAGGTYRCQGFATATNFYATYRSDADWGVFEMKRPAKDL